MNRSAKKQLRKRSLIEATVICVNRYGYSESTVQKIAAEAGLTGGTIYRHFRDKAELFEATMRHLLRQVLIEERAALSEATDDLQCLTAVIASKFAPSLFNPDACTVWLHFWAHAQSRPEFARVESLSDRLLRRSLLRYSRRLMPPAEAEEFTSEIALIIDGLWIAHAQNRSDLNPHTAIEIAQGSLNARLGQ